MTAWLEKHGRRTVGAHQTFFLNLDQIKTCHVEGKLTICNTIWIAGVIKFQLVAQKHTKSTAIALLEELPVFTGILTSKSVDCTK